MTKRETAIALAKLELRGLGYDNEPVLLQLREAYPELDFIFDAMNELTYEYNEASDLSVKLTDSMEELRQTNSELLAELAALRNPADFEPSPRQQAIIDGKDE